MTKFKKLLKAFIYTFLCMFGAFLISLAMTIFAKFFPIAAWISFAVVVIVTFFGIMYHFYTEWK